MCQKYDVRIPAVLAAVMVLVLISAGGCIPHKLETLEPGVWISIEAGYDPDFSPDGAFLVYTESVKGMNWKEDVILYSLQSGQKTRLNQNSFWDGEARWHPQGQKIVFTTDTLGLKNISVFSVTDQTIEELTTGEAYHPAWSPNGQQVVFVSSRSRYSELWLLDLETLVLRQLTNFEKEIATPVWAPDNSRIVFCMNVDGQWDLWQVSLPDGKAKSLFHTVQNECYPRWSPTGRYLAFCSFLQDPKGKVRSSKIWLALNDQNIFPAAVYKLVEAQKDGHKYLYPAFSPDEHRLAFSTNHASYRWDIGFIDLTKKLSKAKNEQEQLK